MKKTCAFLFLIVVCLLAACVFSGACAAVSYTVPSGSPADKLAFLKKVFLPDQSKDWYWNKFKESELGGNQQITFSINGHTTTISTKPCPQSKTNHNWKNGLACSHYWGTSGGWQCTGFARMVFELVWNMDTTADGYFMYAIPASGDRKANTDFISAAKAYDFVYTGGHSIFITGISGSAVNVTDCNKDNHCVIMWNRYYAEKSKIASWAKSNMSNLGNDLNDLEYPHVISHAPIILNDSQCDWHLYRTLKPLNIRRGAKTRTKIEKVLSANEKFYVDTIHQISVHKSTWAYVKSEDGASYGWVNIGLAGYCEEIGGSAVTHPLVITRQPADVIVEKAGDTATTSVAAEGDGLTYQWYRKNPGDKSFALSTVQTPEYSLPLPEKESGRQIYCVITDKYGHSVTSNTVTLSIRAGADPVPAGTQEYEVVYKSGLKINKQYNKSGVSIKVMPKGTHFWADMSTAVYAGKYTWAYCYMADGTEGWVAISEPSYCVPVEAPSVCGHSRTRRIPTKEATCSEAGEVQIICEECGELIATELVTSTPHTAVTDAGKAASCTEAGLTEGKHCSVCGTVITARQPIPPLGHIWSDWKVTRQPEPGKDGEETRVCLRDPSHKETRKMQAPSNPTPSPTAAASPTPTAKPTPSPTPTPTGVPGKIVAGKPGEIVKVPVEVVSNSMAAGATVKLKYDAGILEYIFASAVNGWKVPVGSQGVFWMQNAGSIIPVDAVGTVSFKIRDDAPAGVYGIPVEVSQVQFMGIKDQPPTVACASVMVRRDVIPGDCNGDGKVDGRDLLRLARYLAGAPVSIDLEAADLNQNGTVNGQDLLRLAKKLAASD